MKVLGIDIIIELDHSLSETAKAVSRALGVAMKEELTGRFEECPAYTAKSGGVVYVLLGVPEPEHDISDDPTNDYCLHVWPEREGAVVPELAFVVEALRMAGLRAS
ncbi:hypothetical protein [Solimonas sp. SE-A11]|uniref:hypothetical protein n=1 Tax=Solimonas sp. SE-A11 TaxID=3054954 RepID=UPI00259D30DA|nr:hypothetical protein [Solimonas sp. SE-A11]MDM4771362.1 hypothetical protein [Solimonas sp. SE-A11]